MKFNSKIYIAGTMAWQALQSGEVWNPLDLIRQIQGVIIKTDTQLYKLFSELPEYFFDLTGIHYSSKYTLTSETVKEVSRSMDGLMEPDNPDNPYFVVEFQMQRDDTIYYRTVMEMAAIGIKN